MQAKRFLSNVGLMGISTLLIQGLTILIFLVAARFLTPEDIGVYSIAALIVSYSLLIAEFGGGAYLIHKEEVSGPTINTVFTLNFLLGFLQTGLIFIFTKAIVDFFNIGGNEIIIQLASLNIPLATVASMYKSLLQKNLEFRKNSSIEAGATVVAFFASLIILWSGAGVIALVIFPIARSLLELLMCNFVCKVKVKFYFEKKIFLQIYNYSVYLAISNIVNQLSRSADQLIIGKSLGSEPLGFYSVAYKIMLFPVHRFVGVILRVMFPTLATSRGNLDQLRLSFSQTLTWTVFLSVSIASWLFINIDFLVVSALGEQWSSVADLVMILAPVAIIQTVTSSMGPLFLIQGKTKLGLRLQVVTSLTTILGFIIGINWGIQGICWAYLISNLVLFFPVSIISCRTINMSFLSLVPRLFGYVSLVSISFLGIKFLVMTIGLGALSTLVGSSLFCMAIMVFPVLHVLRRKEKVVLPGGLLG